MKMVDRCVSKEDAAKIEDMIQVIDGIYIGRAGFTDENGQDFKAIEFIYGPDEVEEALKTLLDLYLALINLNDSRYNQWIKRYMDIINLARDMVTPYYEFGHQIGFTGVSGNTIKGNPSDLKALRQIAIKNELEWLEEKVKEE